MEGSPHETEARRGAQGRATTPGASGSWGGLCAARLKKKESLAASILGEKTVGCMSVLAWPDEKKGSESKEKAVRNQHGSVEWINEGGVQWRQSKKGTKGEGSVFYYMPKLRI